MKKYIILILLVLVGSASFAQFGGIGRTTVTKVVGLQDSLNLKISQTQADVRYPLKSDSVAGYTATEIDNIVKRKTSFMKDLEYLGFTIKLVPYQFRFAGSTTLTLTDGGLFTVLMEEIVDTMTVTGIKTTILTTGSFTEDNFNGVALFNVDFDGNYTQIAISDNLPNNFKLSTNALATFPFTAPVVITPNMMVVAAIVYNSSAQTTAPVIPTMSTITTSFAFSGISSPNVKFRGQRFSQATVPATIAVSSITDHGAAPLLFLY